MRRPPLRRLLKRRRLVFVTQKCRVENHTAIFAERLAPAFDHRLVCEAAGLSGVSAFAIRSRSFCFAEERLAYCVCGDHPQPEFTSDGARDGGLASSGKSSDGDNRWLPQTRRVAPRQIEKVSSPRRRHATLFFAELRFVQPEAQNLAAHISAIAAVKR